jgi:hypothetical protein
VAVSLPKEFVAVSVYVIVAPGETSVLADECSSVEVLVPPAKVRESALDTFQLSVVESPLSMLAGLALNEFMTGKSSVDVAAPPSSTITVTVALTVEPPPVAVRV